MNGATRPEVSMGSFQYFPRFPRRVWECPWPTGETQDLPDAHIQEWAECWRTTHAPQAGAEPWTRRQPPHFLVFVSGYEVASMFDLEAAQEAALALAQERAAR